MDTFQILVAKGQDFSVGRDQTNDFVIDTNDLSVSRQHAVFKYINGQWYVEDCASKNGIYINGQRITSREQVSENDQILICLHSFSLAHGYSDLRTEVALQGIGIEKVFPNGHVGLKKMDLEIEYGHFVAVMGPSGCGKSTLLKLLNGDSPASNGTVKVHGLELNSNFQLLKSKIGYVPQDDIIHRELTVQQTMWYAAKIRLPKGTEDNKIKEKILSVLSTLFGEQVVNLIYHKQIKALSGGQRKRLSIAVELLTDPTILFLDEPTSPLDPETIHEFLSKLNTLKQMGTTIVMVTHKPEDLNYTDQIIFLGTGGHHVYQGNSNQIAPYFKQKSLIEVYGLLSDTKRAESYYYQLYSKTHNPSMSKVVASERTTEKVPFFYQLYWLSRRYLQVKLNDKANIRLLILQPVIIALLISIIFKEFQLGVIFLTAIATIWLAVSNAAKEIVNEQSIYKRERMFNLRINPYLLSKISILTLFSFFQIFIFLLIIELNFQYIANSTFDDVYIHDLSGFYGFLLFLSISSTLLGLLLSSYFSTSEKVMTMVPIALLPQIMLAGVITKIDNWGVEILSFLTLGRWGTEGLSRIQDEAAPTLGENSDTLSAVVNFIPILESDTIHVSETCMIPIERPNMNILEPTRKSAMELLDYYNQSLVDAGDLIGDFMNSMSANLSAILILTLLFYASAFILLKSKDTI